MSGYEFMFILDPTLDDAASLAVVERVEGILKAQGGQIVSLNPWERRQLAYPIAGHREGLYMLCYFDAPPDSIRQIESRIRLTDGILRFLVLRTDKETRERDQAADLRRREERAARAATAAAEAALRAETAGQDAPKADGAASEGERTTPAEAPPAPAAADDSASAAAPQPDAGSHGKPREESMGESGGAPGEESQEKSDAESGEQPNEESMGKAS